MAPRTRIFPEAGIVGRVKNGTSSDIQKRRVRQQGPSSSQRGRKHHRGYRSLTPRRQKKIEAFLNQMSMQPADYAEFGSDAWIKELILALDEHKKTAIIPGDVRKWLVIHNDFFKSVMMRINKAHPWLRDDGRPEASGGLREWAPSIPQRSCRNESSTSRQVADDNSLKTAVDSGGKSLVAAAAKIPPAAVNSNPEMGLKEAVKEELEDEASTCLTLGTDIGCQKAEVVVDEHEDPTELTAFVSSGTGSTDAPIIEIGKDNTFKITGSFNGPLFMEVVANLHAQGLLPMMESVILTLDEGCLEGLELIPPPVDRADGHVGRSEVSQGKQLEICDPEGPKAFRNDVMRMLRQLEQLKVREPSSNWNACFHALKIIEDLTVAEENVTKASPAAGNQ